MTKTTKTTPTATNKELSAGFAEITETTELTKTTGIQGANRRFPKPRVRNFQQKRGLENTVSLQALGLMANRVHAKGVVLC